MVAQQRIDDANRQVDLLIHIGNMSDFPNIINPKEVWRVSEDGKIADRYKKLTNVFEMREASFFNLYTEKVAIDSEKEDSYYRICRICCKKLY